MSASASKLFQPIKVGAVTLQHRVVLAPLTRFRSTPKGHVPVNPLMKTYYSQRGSRPGTLLITEATFITPQAVGYDGVPGIWNEEQIAAWKVITDSVHANGSSIFLQLWAHGRAANTKILQEDGHDFVAPSAIHFQPGAAPPRALTIPEIQDYIQWFGQAAHNAVHGAGFDGVEVHCANGYLPDQFLQDKSNQRTDEYGGSVENRSRFSLQVVDAVVKAVGEDRTGIRISPWGTFQGMRMDNPIPQFSHFISSVKSSHPDLAYLHAVEPLPEAVDESNDFIRELWAPKPLITCSGYDRESAIKTADTKGDLIAFGKYYISNPDLPTRLEKGIPLNEYNSSTFYTHDAAGYIDYPFAEETSTQSS
ncbi:NADH:flavin oxidoreductase/NADH oxidase [Pholiota conissans]|uniref:NADH:flavin oxidoreductase/NADH oxidase n=1 Tax=Pholiota conissans TaxID=109636 RepID=A0A9P5YXN6_9AGAR|nr:NADH:flavin oxidoreductase/NADH oxidase [Pholiota conissans]